MRYIGCIKTLKVAKSEARKVAKKSKVTVVLEKAKSKGPDGKWHRCYRAWLDFNIKKPQVITYEQWKKIR